MLDTASASEVLLDVGEPRDGLAFRQRLSVREPGIPEEGHAVAQGAGDLSRFVELHELVVETGRLLETVFVLSTSAARLGIERNPMLMRSDAE